MKSTVPGPRDLHAVLELSANRGLPDACPDGVPCCDGYAYIGPEHCTCWEPVFDIDQATPRVGYPHQVRERMCADCAFRPGSPERTCADAAASDAGDLAAIVRNPSLNFWCHDGIRHIVGHRHPNGMYVPVAVADGVVAYYPPIVDGVPFRADGSPGLACAGLAAARRAKDWTP